MFSSKTESLSKINEELRAEMTRLLINEKWLNQRLKDLEKTVREKDGMITTLQQVVSAYQQTPPPNPSACNPQPRCTASRSMELLASNSSFSDDECEDHAPMRAPSRQRGERQMGNRGGVREGPDHHRGGGGGKGRDHRDQGRRREDRPDHYRGGGGGGGRRRRARRPSN